MKRNIQQKLLAFVTGAAMFLAAVISPAGISHAASAADAKTYEVRIVSTNDLHARAAASESAYGFEKIKTIADVARSSSDLALLLDAGDFYHGQAFATLTNGENIAKLAAATGYDAVCVGNHDWNYGKGQLRTLAKLSAENNVSGGFALLGGNVKEGGGNAFFDQEYLVKELQTGQGEPVKIGVFGMIDPELYTKTAPANVEGLAFENMADYAMQAAASLRSQGCDLVVAMAHCNKPAALAESVSGVDLWITGHEHIVLEDQVTDKAGEKVYVLEAGCYGSQVDVTRLNFTFEPDSSGEYQVSGLTVTPEAYKEDKIETFTSDGTVAALYQSLNTEQEEILKEKIGETPVKLEAGWEAVRIGETTMGRLVTNAYLKESGADVAFENSGGIRTGKDIEAGDVTKGDAIDTFPYGNYLVSKEITGAQLKEMLEISIDLGIQNIAANEAGEYDGWPGNSGSYLQVSGAQVLYDTGKPKGSRIWSLKIGGEPVEDAKYYTVATNNYAAGSEDYPMFAGAEIKNEYGACDEIFIRYLQQTEPEILKAALETACMTEQKENNSSQDLPAKPKASNIKKLTAKSRGFQVTWKKRSSVTGYQIQYSTDQKFGKAVKKVNVNKPSSVKKTVKGLKAKKTYYVRIRTYQKKSVSVSYSNWSGVKWVTTL